MTHANLRLYRHPLSGHSHRAELLLSLLELPYERTDVDLASRAHKSEKFTRKNPFGQVPVLEDGDLVLSDSNAILVYLATRYDPARRWLPVDAAAAARVQRWLSVAAGELSQGPGAARLVAVFNAPLDQARARAIAERLFAVVEQELSTRAFLAGSSPTLADIAMYTYTAHAPEGGVALDGYPHIQRWLGAIEALPHFVGMQRTPARS